MWLENPSVFATEYIIETGPGDSGRDWTETVKAILGDVAQALKQEGCRLIGHIKALAQGATEGHLYASLVSLEQGTSIRGELPAELRQVRLTLNLIVYGFEKDRLPELVERCVRSRLPGAVRVGPRGPSEHRP